MKHLASATILAAAYLGLAWFTAWSLAAWSVCPVSAPR